MPHILIFVKSKNKHFTEVIFRTFKKPSLAEMIKALLIQKVVLL